MSSRAPHLAPRATSSMARLLVLVASQSGWQVAGGSSRPLLFVHVLLLVSGSLSRPGYGRGWAVPLVQEGQLRPSKQEREGGPPCQQQPGWCWLHQWHHLAPSQPASQPALLCSLPLAVASGRCCFNQPAACLPAACLPICAAHCPCLSAHLPAWPAPVHAMAAEIA